MKRFFMSILMLISFNTFAITQDCTSPNSMLAELWMKDIVKSIATTNPTLPKSLSNLSAAFKKSQLAGEKMAQNYFCTFVDIPGGPLFWSFAERKGKELVGTDVRPSLTDRVVITLWASGGSEAANRGGPVCYKIRMRDKNESIGVESYIVLYTKTLESTVVASCD